MKEIERDERDSHKLKKLQRAKSKRAKETKGARQFPQGLFQESFLANIITYILFNYHLRRQCIMLEQN